MLPVIKSDHWAKKEEQSQTANVQKPLQVPVVYVPLQQQGVPVMYSTAPVTIHHAPNATYHNNPGPDTYLPYLERPPPTYSPTAPDEPAKFQIQHVSNVTPPVVTLDNVQTLNSNNNDDDGGDKKEPGKQTLLSKFKVSKPVKKCDTSNAKVNSIVELNTIDASNIIETFDTIEDGLTDTLQQEKNRSSVSYNMLKCCRVSVRTVKHVLIALVAFSAVYTAGIQMYEHLPVGGLLLNIFSTNQSNHQSPDLTVLNQTSLEGQGNIWSNSTVAPPVVDNSSNTAVNARDDPSREGKDSSVATTPGPVTSVRVGNKTTATSIPGTDTPKPTTSISFDSAAASASTLVSIVDTTVASVVTVTATVPTTTTGTTVTPNATTPTGFDTAAVSASTVVSVVDTTVASVVITPETIPATSASSDASSVNADTPKNSSIDSNERSLDTPINEPPNHNDADSVDTPTSPASSANADTPKNSSIDSNERSLDTPINDPPNENDADSVDTPASPASSADADKPINRLFGALLNALKRR